MRSVDLQLSVLFSSETKRSCSLLNESNQEGDTVTATPSTGDSRTFPKLVYTSVSTSFAVQTMHRALAVPKRAPGRGFIRTRTVSPLAPSHLSPTPTSLPPKANPLVQRLLFYFVTAARTFYVGSTFVSYRNLQYHVLTNHDPCPPGQRPRRVRRTAPLGRDRRHRPYCQIHLPFDGDHL